MAAACPGSDRNWFSSLGSAVPIAAAKVAMISVDTARVRQVSRSFCKALQSSVINRRHIFDVPYKCHVIYNTHGI